MKKDIDGLADALATVQGELTDEERGRVRESLIATRDLPPDARLSVCMATAQLAIGLGRRRKKARYNKISDKRTLIGVHVGPDRAHAYREAAAAQGVSLYRWVLSALDAALRSR